MTGRGARLVVPALLTVGLAGCGAPGQRASSVPPSRIEPAAPAPGTAAPRSPGNPPFYEVFGERYYVMDSAAGYRERGVASWYGRDFHGKRTSGGEVYDMYQLTAAHKTLPIPTWVEVTNLANGKRITVKVNDRGPFVDDRIIDLSYQAAMHLDMVRAGTQFVEVRAVPAAQLTYPDARLAEQRPERGGFSLISEAVADTPGPDDRAFQQIYVQVGAFSERANADGLHDRLRDGGFANAFVVSASRADDRLHRVRIGPLADVAEFDRVSGELRAMGFADSRLVVE